MMDSDYDKIREVKSKVLAMLEERHALAGNNGHGDILPSKYWSDFCSYFAYLFDLPERHFADLRLHTYHLTGDNYQFYYFGDADGFRLNYNVDALEKELPSEYLLNELERGIGHRFKNGRFISSDIVRYQRIVSNLYRHKVFSELKGLHKDRIQVLEIGGGYGALAHHLSNLIGKATYFMIDLPETLLFSGSYLSLHNPEKRVYIYDKDSFPSVIRSGEIGTYDFVLLPNYQLHSLDHLQFDLVINISSLQEMRTRQAEEYLDFIKRTCQGVFYSWNEDRQSLNKEMTSVSELIKRRFEVVEVTEENLYIEPATSTDSTIRKLIKTAAVSAGIIKRNPPAPVIPPYTTENCREYICRPLPAVGPIEERREGAGQ